MKDIIPQEAIEKNIYLIRSQKIMLDKDLAALYGVKPIRLREQANGKGVDFMVSQNARLEKLKSFMSVLR